MKAMILNMFGGPEVLRLTEIPTPVPQANQVLIRNKAIIFSAQKVIWCCLA